MVRVVFGGGWSPFCLFRRFPPLFQGGQLIFISLFFLSAFCCDFLRGKDPSPLQGSGKKGGNRIVKKQFFKTNRTIY